MNYNNHLLLPQSIRDRKKNKHSHPCTDCNFCLPMRFSEWRLPDQGNFISKKEGRQKVNGFVPGGFNWALSSAVILLSSRFSHSHVFPNSLSTLLHCSPSHSSHLCARCHQPSRCSLQQVLVLPSATCPKAALLHPNHQAGGKLGILHSVEPPAHHLPFLRRGDQENKIAPLCLILTWTTLQISFTTLTSKFFPGWHYAVTLLSLIASPVTPQ